MAAISEPQSSSQAVVLYDGQCRFCRGQISNLRRLDWFHRLRFVSLHEDSVALDYPDLSHEQLMEQMWIVTPNRERYGGAYALRYLTRFLPSLWLLAPAMHLPGLMPFWNRMYRWIAQRRYKIAGRECPDGSCALHAQTPKR